MKWTWPTIWDDERGGWWRLAVTLGLVLVAFHFLPVLARRHLPPLLAGFLPRTLVLAVLLAAVRFVHRKPIRCVFTDGRPFGISLALQSALVLAVLAFLDDLLLPDEWQWLAQRAGEIASGWRTELPKSLLSAAVVTTVLEEVFFRGYLLPRLAAWLKRPWLAVGLTAMLFSAAHFGRGTSFQIVLFAWGVLLGVACIRTGTLAPVIAFHFTTNSLVALSLPNRHEVGWRGDLGMIVELLIWFAWLLWATRRKPVQTTAQPDGPANRSQPVGSETERTSAAAGSGR